MKPVGLTRRIQRLINWFRWFVTRNCSSVCANISLRTNSLLVNTLRSSGLNPRTNILTCSRSSQNRFRSILCRGCSCYRTSPNNCTNRLLIYILTNPAILLFIVEECFRGINNKPVVDNPFRCLFCLFPVIRGGREFYCTNNLFNIEGVNILNPGGKILCCMNNFGVVQHDQVAEPDNAALLRMSRIPGEVNCFLLEGRS